MKAIALDCAAAHIQAAARNGSKYIETTIDTGTHQSEKLLPVIDYILTQTEMSVPDLDFVALTGGPGSFTGLRLAFAACKALSLTAGIPMYAIPTLTAYAYPYRNAPCAVIPALDAKKQRFYASIYRQGKEIEGPADVSVCQILSWIDPEETVLIAGPDSQLLYGSICEERPCQRVIAAPVQFPSAAALLEIGGKWFAENKTPSADFEGPIYIRKSEAEETAGTK